VTKQIELVVEPDGTTRHLVDSLSESIGAAVGPKVQTWRNSHVETWSSLSKAARDWLHDRALDMRTVNSNHFWADMLPVNGPVLGPFQSHAQAIDAEVRWLSERNFPVPTAATS